MQLNNQLLLKNLCLINGHWVGNGSKRQAVFNPASEETIETVPCMSAQQVEEAIQAAHTALSLWRTTPAKEKAQLMHKWYCLVLEHELDLAQIISDETGKPLEEAVAEVRYGASFIEWFCQLIEHHNGEIIPSDKNSLIFVTREPVGVCALITPWNFPNAMLTRKIAPALAAGCTVVVKPSKEAPFSALALAELAMMVGFPKGVMNIVTGESDKIVKVLTSHPLVRQVSFTGSTKVGEELKRQCVITHKHTAMELGGNAPFIIFDDADLEEACKGLMHAKFRNSGQTCVAANRVLVQKKIYPRLLELLKQKVTELRMGDPYQQDVELGPLINEAAVKKVDALVQTAVKEGATLVIGGKVSSLGACFYEPTIITEVTPSMMLFEQEIFGPVLSLIAFETEEEALYLANKTTAGLAAYCYSKDLARMLRVSRELQFGMVGGNTGSISYASVPFGGMKHSGEGREGSNHGLDAYLEIKTTILSGIQSCQ